MMRQAKISFSRRLAGDDGIALAMALIFVMVMALTVTALLPYTGTGLKASTAVREVRTVQNAADGAVDQAINSIRGSFVLGASPSCTSGGPHPVYTAPDFTNPAPDVGVTKIRVHYCNDASSTPPPDQPPYAMQTLVGGIDVDGNDPLQVTGGILANGPLDVKGALQSVNVQGDLFATGDCSAKSALFVSGVQHCANTTPAYASGTDPDPTVDPLASLPEPTLPTTVDPLGTCGAGAESVVTFSPGFYSTSPVPDPSSCTGTKHTVWWFQPGVYYFDFPDENFTSAQFGDYQNGDAQFRAQNITIVAGTPSNWSPATSKSKDVQELFTKDPNHTKPACAEGSPGALFAFGGPTYIEVGTGAGVAPEHLEICSTGVGSQYLSIFGLRNAPIRSTTPVLGVAQPATETSTAGLPGYLPAGAARVVDGTAGVAALVGGAATTNKASVKLEDFSDVASTIPDGSIITSLQLRVNHWSSSALGTSVAAKVKPSIVYSAAGYPSTSENLTVTTAQPAVSGGQIVPLPLPSGTHRWRAVEAAIQNLVVTFQGDGSTLAGIKVTGPTTTPAETANSHLDGIHLEIGYVAPAIERTRCSPPTDPNGACSLVINKVDDALFPHGTVYAPRSVIEAAVHGYSSTVFERGVLAASIIVTVNASAKQTLPPFQLPLGPSLRVVRFTAQSLEPDGSWKDRIVALVRYDDFVMRPGGKTTAAPGHTVTVQKWTVRR